MFFDDQSFKIPFAPRFYDIILHHCYINVRLECM